MIPRNFRIQRNDQILFPNVPLVWSGLDDQSSPVLKEFSSQLMVFSSLVAEFVTLWVAVDAITQEASEIVLFLTLLVFFVILYLQSILSLTFIWCSFMHLLLCYLVFPFSFGCNSSFYIEFEA